MAVPLSGHGQRAFAHRERGDRRRELRGLGHMNPRSSGQRFFKGRVKRLIAIAASACLVGGGAAGAVLGTAARAGADTQGPITFESGYTTGSVNGQNGWAS